LIKTEKAYSDSSVKELKIRQTRGALEGRNKNASFSTPFA
jgi:hypothetical protein